MVTSGHRTSTVLNGETQETYVNIPMDTVDSYLLETFEHAQNLPKDKTDTNQYHWARTQKPTFETDDKGMRTEASPLDFILSVACLLDLI